MKKIELLITSLLLCTFFAEAQTMYVMKGGVSVKEYDVATGVDSVIFYNPVVTPPVADVPLYDLSNKAFGLKSANGNTTASGWGGGWQDGAVKQYVYQSAAVGGLVGFDVIFPPSYDSSPNKRYPVIYHLHGKGEDLGAYRYNGALNTFLPNNMNNKSIGEFIFISVGGPASCWWSDGKDGTKAESHIIELISAVDQKFRTIGTQKGRAIMGFSMGGFGAHKIAIKYPQYFAVGAPYCGATYSAGYVNSATNPQGFGFSEYTTIWANDNDYNTKDCGRNLLSSKAASIKSNGTAFVIRCKTSDLFTAHNRSFRDELNALGISNTFLEGPGGHDMGDMPVEFFTSILQYMSPAQ